MSEVRAHYPVLTCTIEELPVSLDRTRSCSTIPHPTTSTIILKIQKKVFKKPGNLSLSKKPAYSYNSVKVMKIG